MKVEFCRTRPGDAAFPSALTVGRVYEVIGIEADHFRIVDDTASPYLFDPACFRVVDASEPEFWVETRGHDGERYAYPAEFAAVGFFEDYFDRKAAARSLFWETARRLFPEAVEAARTQNPGERSGT